MTDQPPSRPNKHNEAVATRPPALCTAIRPVSSIPAHHNTSSGHPGQFELYQTALAGPEHARRPRLAPTYPYHDSRLGEAFPARSQSKQRPASRQAPHPQLSHAGPELRRLMVPVSRYVPYPDRRPPPPVLRRPIYPPPPPDRYTSHDTNKSSRPDFSFPPRLSEIDEMMGHPPQSDEGGYQLSKGAQRDERWRSRQREREVEAQRTQRERNRYEYEAYYRERGHHPPAPAPEGYDQLGRYDYGPDNTYPYRGGPYPPRPFRRSPCSPGRLPPDYMEGPDRRTSLSSIASTLRRNSAVLYPEILGVGSDTKGQFPPRAEGAEREALLDEQERAIAAARKALAEERLKREQTGVSIGGMGMTEQKEVPQMEMTEEDKVRRRRVQLQVFVHARPTYCRWGQCRAVLNSWALLEKHVLHAHIKPLEQATASEDHKPTDGSATPKVKKLEIHCHWAECTKVYADKDRMYRHCLVEHMGEFCARCPFNCLFEGSTFPSLMAHISRRHPKATPDDFVPGLIHFEPQHPPPKALPANEIIQPITMQDPNGRPLYTPIVPSFMGQPAGSAHRLRLAKVVTMGCMILCADHTGIKKEKKDARVAGKVIGEIVRLSVKAAEERREWEKASIEVRTGAMLERSAQIDKKIDAKAIAKQVKAAIKLESNTSRSISPSSSTRRSDSNELNVTTQSRAVSDTSVPADLATSGETLKGSQGTLPVSLSPEIPPKIAIEGSRATWDILVGATTITPTPALSRVGTTTDDKKDEARPSPSPTPSQTPSSPPSSASEFKLRLKVSRPISPTSAGLKRDLEAEEAEEVARRLRPRRQRM